MTLKKRSPFIIAHRGASVAAPENTLAAFRHAISAGADGIELDVRLAADGVAVVIHDPDLKRTAGVGGRVSSYSSEELSKFDVGSWFTKKSTSLNGRFIDQKLPLLKDVLADIAAFPGFIYIELKCKKNDAELLAKAVAEAVTAADTSGTIIIKSFRLAAIAHFRRRCPGISRQDRIRARRG